MKNTSSTPLCKIAFKYGTDKCPDLKHTYTPFYYELFKKSRNAIKKVLEIGIGTYKGMRNRHYHRGASLYMWREFFPNAQIYGADFIPENLFEDERIKTYLCDERKSENLVKLIQNTGPDIDLLVDDASHNVVDQIFTCQTLMPLFKKDCTYIIEDVTYSKIIIRNLDKYDCLVPKILNQGGNNQLLIVKNK